jgi:hypothetical protein
MSTFITPPGYSGTAELTASNGLTVIKQGSWKFSQAGYNDGATFGLSLGWPMSPDNAEVTYGAPPPPHSPITGGELHLSAQDWTIATIGNSLISYTDPTTHITYPADVCRILVTGRWQVIRQINSNSWNGVGIRYNATTVTDQGSRDMNPYLLSYTSAQVSYVIQGADVDGGAQDTFSDHVFECRATEQASTTNSNGEFQSNSITRPVWEYSYSMSWQTS